MARPGIGPGTSCFWVRPSTDCATWHRQLNVTTDPRSSYNSSVFGYAYLCCNATLYQATLTKAVWSGSTLFSLSPVICHIYRPYGFCVGTSLCSVATFQRETACLLPWATNSFYRRKEFAPRGENIFPLQVEPRYEGKWQEFFFLFPSIFSLKTVYGIACSRDPNQAAPTGTLMGKKY